MQASDVTLKWGDSHLLGYTPMDEIHEEFVQLVGQMQQAADEQLPELLDALQRIEREQGRVRKAERWGPRTLDLDILLFGERLLAEERLTVPHYHMHARAFVLYPLAEIAPADLQLPDGRSLPALLAACPYAGLERLAERAL